MMNKLVRGGTITLSSFFLISYIEISVANRIKSSMVLLYDFDFFFNILFENTSS